jgi:hypothetical protein
MSDRAANTLAGAIALCAIAYFLTHLHVSVSAGMAAYVTNTMTGHTTLCNGAQCYAGIDNP